MDIDICLGHFRTAGILLLVACTALYILHAPSNIDAASIQHQSCIVSQEIQPQRLFSWSFPLLHKLPRNMSLTSPDTSVIRHTLLPRPPILANMLLNSWGKTRYSECYYNYHPPRCGKMTPRWSWYHLPGTEGWRLYPQHSTGVWTFCSDLYLYLHTGCMHISTS
jgi:hypothetical protein